MKNFVVYVANGDIKRTGTCSDDDFSLQAGLNELVIEGEASDVTQMVVNGLVINKPPVIITPPVFNLATAQTIKLEYLNTRYDLANTGKFSYLGIEYNGDAIAQNNFNSTANYINNFNTFPPNFPNAWIADNGSVLIFQSVNDFWPLFQAYVAQGVYNITHFSMLKAQLFGLPATATQANIDAIVW